MNAMDFSEAKPRRFSWLKLLCFLLGFLLVIDLLPLTSRVAPHKQWSCKNAGPKTSSITNLTELRHAMKPVSTESSIPNIIHFVNLKPDDEVSNTTIRFPLRMFVAVYSASYYLKPDTIYIHTNIEKDLIGDALKYSSNPYVQALRRMPEVKFNYVVSPTKTNTGRNIDLLAHRSDFVRLEMLKKYGGIYLDDDVYALRDLKPLRELGYHTVTGRQSNDQVCNAVILSSPGNPFIETFYELSHRVFDGAWTTHSVDLLTHISKAFQKPDLSTLVMSRETFFPGSWKDVDLLWMYQQHETASARAHDSWVVDSPSPMENLTHYIESYKTDAHEQANSLHQLDWEYDWRDSYAVHGWTSGIKGAFSEEAREQLMGHKDGTITLDYLLSRKSNLARALYPAVQDAVDRGLLKADEPADADS